MFVTQIVPSTDRLEAILQAKRREIEERRARADVSALERAARSQVRRPFASALLRPGRAIIAEMKKASPSRGLLREDYHPDALARAYHGAGARAISVLTDGPFFGGALEHLAEVRAASPLPVLRKDFLLDEFQMLESAAAGADAVLLIVAAFSGEQGDAARVAALRRMMTSARSWGMDLLLEVHNEEELDLALAARATVVGVNNRDLRTFSVDVETSVRLAPKVKRTIAVSESGLRSSQDLARLEALGYRAFLVGEQLMSAKDPAAALEALLCS